MHFKSKYLYCVVGLLCGLILIHSSPIVFYQNAIANPFKVRERVETDAIKDISIAYIEREPIEITTNANFSDYGFPGDGTVDNPYTISGYNITTTDTCISIKNTDAYFTIQDCYLFGIRNGEISYYCIRLDSVINGKIENNTISGSVNGIFIDNSPSITISNNSISGTTSGIIISSSNAIIANNTIAENNYYGIEFRYALNATLLSNSLINSGIHISEGSLDSWKHTIGTDNLVNGKPIGYFWNLTTGVIDGSPYGQVILANCTGITVKNGIFENCTVGIELGYSTYCTIEDNAISGAWSGVAMESSSENIVTNNNILESRGGILIRDSANTTIDSNDISDNHADGVYIQNCINITVERNTVSRSDIGVAIWESTNCTLTENVIRRNRYGFYFSSTFISITNNIVSDNLLFGLVLSMCVNNTILDNTFTNNGLSISGGPEYYQNNIIAGNQINGKPLGLFLNRAGETIDGSQYGQVFIVNCTDVILEGGQFNNASVGIILRDSSFCIIQDSVVSGNSVAGVALYVSPNNTIMKNNITGNPGDGVRLGWSDNTVVNNVISDNSGAGVHVVYKSNMTVAHNVIERNQYGVQIMGSSNNTVHNNTIIGNSVYGVYVEHEFDSNNLFYFNILAYNEEANAFDDGNNNHWNLTENGNFWSDYSGTGMYYILGDAGSIDYHPFIYVPPETSTPTDSTDDIGDGLILIFIGVGLVGVISIAFFVRRLRGPRLS